MCKQGKKKPWMLILSDQFQALFICGNKSNMNHDICIGICHVIKTDHIYFPVNESRTSLKKQGWQMMSPHMDAFPGQYVYLGLFYQVYSGVNAMSA